MKVVPVRGLAAEAKNKKEYTPRQMVSHLFHQLSQPLTSLRCSLELALVQTHTAEEYCYIVSQALGEAEKVSWLATAIREMHDAGQAGEDPEILDLSREVANAIDDLLPVAESAGVHCRYLPRPPCPVWFDPRKLRLGLFHLLGSVVGAGGRGSVVRIEVEELAEVVALRLTISDGTAAFGPELSQEYPPRELAQRLGVGIARAIFEAAGGSLRIKYAAHESCFEVRIAGREVR